MRKSTIIALAVLVCYCQQLNAQNAVLQASQTMQSVYRNYDSIKYLSFDVKFTYGSDTILGVYDAEKMDASYTMAGKKAKYRIGDIDFMQNDSFFIAIYNRDKLILVDEPKTSNSGSQLPMRQQMDSLMLGYANHYTFTNYDQAADTGVISLIRLDSLAQFDKFSITYDKRNKMLYQVSYEYKEPAQLDTAAITILMTGTNSTTPPMQKKRLTIQFLNYRYDNYDDAIYDINNYIWFENGICKPVKKFNEYKIYNSKPVVK